MRRGYRIAVSDSNTGADAVAPDPIAVCRPQTGHDATNAKPFMLFVTVPAGSKDLCAPKACMWFAALGPTVAERDRGLTKS